MTVYTVLKSEPEFGPATSHSVIRSWFPGALTFASNRSWSYLLLPFLSSDYHPISLRFAILKMAGFASVTTILFRFYRAKRNVA